MPFEMFKRWKPVIFNAIKKDYNLESEDEDEGAESVGDDGSVSDSDDIFPINIPDPPATPLLVEGSDIPRFVPSGELKQLLMTISDKVDKVVQPTESLHTLKDGIRDCFKCVVCLEPCLDGSIPCFKCARLVGCMVCVSVLEVCPLCRAPLHAKVTFPNGENSETLSHSMLIKVPGLQLLLS